MKIRRSKNLAQYQKNPSKLAADNVMVCATLLIIFVIEQGKRCHQKVVIGRTEICVRTTYIFRTMINDKVRKHSSAPTCVCDNIVELSKRSFPPLS